MKPKPGFSWGGKPIMLDRGTVAAALCEMTDAETLAMQDACGDDPLAVSQYLLDQYGLDGLIECVAKHRDEASRAIEEAVREREPQCRLS